jgi:hypothetical protein
MSYAIIAIGGVGGCIALEESMRALATLMASGTMPAHHGIEERGSGSGMQ